MFACLDLVCIPVATALGNEQKPRLTRAIVPARFNKIGLREMYMDCAVVDLVASNDVTSPQSADDAASIKQPSNANLAQAALSHLPDLYVANLKGINDCTTVEATDVVFDDPGKDVVYGHSLGAASSRIVRRKKGNCTGLGRASDLTLVSSDSLHVLPALGASPAESPGGNDGMWHPDQTLQIPAYSTTIDRGHDGLPHYSHGLASIMGSVLDVSALPPDSASSEVEADSKSFSDTNLHSEVELQLDKYLAALGNDRSTSRKKDHALQNSSPSTHDKNLRRPPPGKFFKYSSDRSPGTNFRAQLTNRQSLTEEQPTAAPDAAGSTSNVSDSIFAGYLDHTEDGDNENEVHGLTPDSDAYDLIGAFNKEDEDTSHIHPYANHLLALLRNIIDDIDFENDNDYSNALSIEQVAAFGELYDRLKETKKPKRKSKDRKKGKHGSSQSVRYSTVQALTKLVIPGEDEHASRMNQAPQSTFMKAMSSVNAFPEITPTPTMNVHLLASLTVVSGNLLASSTQSIVEAASSDFQSVAIDYDVLKTSSGSTSHFAIATAADDGCTPGTFLCKSQTQFWVCGQFGDGNWAYGALRDVSQGLMCKEGVIDRPSISSEIKTPAFWIDADATKDAESKSLEPTVGANEDSIASDTLDILDIYPADKKLHRTIQKRQDYGDDIQVPGFYYSEGGDGGNGIDDVGEAASEMFGQPYDSVNGDTTGENESNDDTISAGDDPSAMNISKESVHISNDIFEDAGEKKDGTKEDIPVVEGAVGKYGESEITPSNATVRLGKVRPKFPLSYEGQYRHGVQGGDRPISDIGTHVQVQREEIQGREIPVAPLPLPTVAGSGRFLALGGVGNVELAVLPGEHGRDNPERYDWGELDKRQSVVSLQNDIPVLSDEVSVRKRQVVDSQVFTPYTNPTQASASKESSLQDLNVSAPPGFDFSDGSDGGDGVEQDPIALFGMEPENYGSQWGVDENAQQNDSTPVIEDDLEPEMDKISVETSTERTPPAKQTLLPKEIGLGQTSGVQTAQEPAYIAKERSVSIHEVENFLKHHNKVARTDIAPLTSRELSAISIDKSLFVPSCNKISSPKKNSGISNDNTFGYNVDLDIPQPLSLSSSAKKKSRPAPGTWDAPDTVTLENVNAILPEYSAPDASSAVTAFSGSIAKSPRPISKISKPAINNSGVALAADAGAVDKDNSKLFQELAKYMLATPWDPDKAKVFKTQVNPLYTDDETKDIAESVFTNSFTSIHSSIDSSDSFALSTGVSNPDGQIHDNSWLNQRSKDYITKSQFHHMHYQQATLSAESTLMISTPLTSPNNIYNRPNTSSCLPTVVLSSSPTSLTKTDSSAIRSAWADGVFDFHSAHHPSNNVSPVPTANTVASILPYFFGPGPVLPSGVKWKLPRPYSLHRTTFSAPTFPSTLPCLTMLVISSSTYVAAPTVTGPVSRYDNMVPVGVGLSVPWPPLFPGVTSLGPPSLPEILPSAVSLKEKVLRRAIVHQDKKGGVARRSIYQSSQEM